MAKTGYKIDWIVRDIGADTSDLLAIHQKVFPGNILGILKTKDKMIIKVSNFNEITGKTLAEAKSEASYIEPKAPNG